MIFCLDAALRSGLFACPTGENQTLEPVFLFDLDGTLVDSVYQMFSLGRKPSTRRVSNCHSGKCTARSV